jgi:ATP-dependent Clp protease ATP-binding subunit ClpA
MKFIVPLYVESWKAEGQKATQHTVRPLFFETPGFTSELLGKAIQRVVTELQKIIHDLGRDGKHEEAARYAFCPALEQHRLKLDFEVSGEVLHFPMAVFTFHEGAQRIGFLPAAIDGWFALERGDNLEVRTHEVVLHLLRSATTKGYDPKELAQRYALRGKAAVTTVDFDCDVTQQLDEKPQTLFALFGAAEKMHGSTELERTGRCLDRLFPDRLANAQCRETEIDELDKLLSAKQRQPLLVVGPRRAGKTVVIHSIVRRIVERRGSAFKNRRNVWLLSPQRLISGMSFVGQWESRLRAILDFAAEQDHTLYFDDLVSAFRAGISRDSDLNVAQLLKPCLEQRSVRILGEVTPEALRVLRERDRAFADLFHIVRVEETDPPTTLRVLLALVRQLERSHGCRFELDVLPETIDLCRHFRPEAAFPGKAADVLLRLAARRRHQEITREHVLEDFRAYCGLERRFLDQRTTLERKSIVEGLGEMLVGQRTAVEAAADVLSLAKAGIQDPRRPLGSLLLLGPTGVGKTQCAKAIARYVFGSAERLLRFDMNEFVSPWAAARLVGTFDQPEGLLTRAVARQPFAVLLLDEIEKAHADVFDLLLQVLGEGRLTDALGRTVDFTNSIVLLTSNLGSREAAGSLGFTRTDSDRAAIYQKAVREFFRPEFVNRLDHVVPFDRLTHEEVLRVSRMILRELAARDGLVRRKCALNVPDDVLQSVVRESYDAAWGARGIRRAIEQRLVRPAACALAAVPPAGPAVISFVADAAGASHVWLETLRNVEVDPYCVAAFKCPDQERVLQAAERMVDRLEDTWRPLRPQGSYDPARLTAQQEMALEQLQCLREMRVNIRRLREQSRLDERERSRAQIRGSRPLVTRPRLKRLQVLDPRSPGPGRTVMAEIASALDVHDYLAGLDEQDDPDAYRWYVEAAPEEWDAVLNLAAVIRRAAWLEIHAPRETRVDQERVLLMIRGISGDEFMRLRLAANSFGFACERELAASTPATCDNSPDEPRLSLRPATVQRLRQANTSALVLEGRCVDRLIDGEAGSHIYFHNDGTMSLAVIEVHIHPPDATAEESILAALNRSGTSSPAEPPSFPPVVRLYEERGLVVDFRSGLSCDTGMVPYYHLGNITLPPEFRKLHS